jgi:hypothetical protein
MINQDTVESLREWLDFISDDWVGRHTNISFDNTTNTITLLFDNVNEEEYRTISDSFV